MTIQTERSYKKGAILLRALEQKQAVTRLTSETDKNFINQYLDF